MQAALDLSSSAATAMMDHPRFAEATLLAAAAIIASYNGNWIVNRLANDRGRMLTALMVLDLHFIDGDGAGFTVAQLRAQAVEFGFASPRRVAGLVASLRLVGLLKSFGAGRPERLMPSEAFLTLHRMRMRRQWEAVRLIHPDGDIASARLDEPRFLGTCARSLMQSYRTGVRLLVLVPELDDIADRDAGMTVLVSLFLAHATGQTVSIAGLARRFLVSRSHVLSLFRLAEQAGLAVRAGPRQHYQAGPMFTDVLHRFFASIFLLNIHVIDTALQTCQPAE